MAVNLNEYVVFMLVMLRMTGMLVTNPILGRRNIPTMLNAGFAFILAILLTTSMDIKAPTNPSTLEFILLAVKELSVGMVASFILQAIMSIMIIAGEIMDMQLGIGMAKVFDPGSNSSISLSSTLLNSMFVLLFFSTNSHLTLISMTAQTYKIIPIGFEDFNWEITAYIPQFFGTIFVLAMKLCMPIVVIEIIVTMAVGIIMRIIPQINIFVVNIQFKLIIGIFALVVLVGPFMGYFENIITICLEQIGTVWERFTL